MKRAIGLVELRSIARGMSTTDKMLKAANVELLRAHVVCPGKYIILIAGNISNVRTAVEVGQEVAPGSGGRPFYFAQCSSQYLPGTDRNHPN